MVEILLRQRYTASDPQSVTEALRAVFGVGTAMVESGGALLYEQVSLVDDGISATRISSSGPAVRVQAVEIPDLIVLAVHTGAVEMVQAQGSVALGPGDLGVVPFEGTVEARWQDVTMDAFSLPRASLRRLLGGTTPTAGVHATRLKAASPSVTALWTRTAALLAGEVLQKRELFESDVIREQAIDALVAVTIEAFGLANAEEDDSRTDDALVRRASEHMRAHLGESISIPDVARSIGVSVRGLQLAFQRSGWPTPLMHLRALRMESARASLIEAAATTSVGTIARGLGYTNIGRFSAHYREAFDEYPAETRRSAART